MRFGVLGQLEVVCDDDAAVNVAGAKERLLLAVLIAAAPGVVSVERLFALLWNGSPPPTANKSLQAHVVRLRSALEPDRAKGSTGRYVVRRGPGYALAVGREGVDALQLSDLAARARAQLSSGDPVAAARQLRAALALWRGDPYADWPDAPFAVAERRRLAEVRAGAVTDLLEAELALGHHAEVLPELEALVADEPLREHWWSMLMLALYREGRQGDALAAGRRVRALLAEELGADPGPALRRVETAILQQDPSLDLPVQRRGADADPERLLPPGGRSEPAGSCPYLGLNAYQAADAAWFRGRQRVVRDLVRCLVDAPLLVVSGPSGAGKSSVVRAGLVPALGTSAVAGSAAWRPVILTPGRNAVDALAGLTGETPPERPVLLVCDQFEELWAPGSDAAERAAFIDAVLGLLEDGVVVRCVAVVRGDHVGRLAEHAALTERLGRALVLVPPLTDPELREVVAEPARIAGLAVESELLDAVVTDVVGRVGALPLLSTALVGTWDRRRGDVLTLAGYLEAGGVAGALTRSAEAAYAALDDRGRGLAQRVLVRLADAEEPGLLVRRPMPLQELDLTGPGGAARREMVEEFVRRRLLAVDEDRLEVAHEALLTEWPRLARWLEEDTAGRAVRRHLAPAALEWDSSRRPGDELYRGARLGAALEWAAGPAADLTPVERSFLDASATQAEADLRAAHERAEREAAARRRARRLATGLAGVLVLALVAGGVAVSYQRDAFDRAAEAVAASTVADANRLAALSATVASTDLSLLLAAQAVRLADTPETQDGLLAALVESRRTVRVVRYTGRAGDALLVGEGEGLFIAVGDRLLGWQVGPTSAPRVVLDTLDLSGWQGWEVAAASPTEGVMAAAGTSDEPWLRLAGIDGSQRLLLEGEEMGGSPVDAVFSPDGRFLRMVVVTAEGDGPEGSWRWELREVDPRTGTVAATGLAGTVPDAGTPLEGTLSADGSTVLWSRPGEGPATLMDLASGRHATLAADPRPFASLGFFHIPGGAAQAWADGSVTLYDSSGSAVQELDWHRSPVRAIVVSPDGTWGVTAGDAGAVVRWDIDGTTGEWSIREVMTGHTGDVVTAQLDPAGRLLFTVSLDGTVVVSDMTEDGGFGAWFPGLSDRWISNRPETVEPGSLLVAPTRTSSRLGADPVNPAPDTLSVAATFFDPETGRVVDQVVVGDTIEQVLFGSSVAVSRDRVKVAVTSGLATTILDTRTRAVLGSVVLPPTGDVDTHGQPLTAQVVWCAGWTPDGSRLLLGAEGDAAAGTGGSLVVVDAATWEVERRIDIGGAPQTIETSPDGRLLAVAVVWPLAEVKIIDAATLEVLHTVQLGDDYAYDLSFSPDGRLLAVGGELGLLHVIDAASWRAVQPATKVHAESVSQVEWTPDGRTVVTAGIDETVSLFDVARGLVRGGALPASSDAGQGYTHLVPGTSGEVIALSGHRSGRRYPLDPAVWLAEACAVAGRDLTRAEWARFLPDQPYAPTCSDLS